MDGEGILHMENGDLVYLAARHWIERITSENLCFEDVRRRLFFENKRIVSNVQIFRSVNGRDVFDSSRLRWIQLFPT